MVSKCNSVIVPGSDAMNHNLRPTQVLVVHEEMELCWQLRRILEDKGFGVTVAVSARAALRAVKEKPCEIVFVNSRLPDVKGIELVRRILRVKQEIICILISDNLRRDERAIKTGLQRAMLRGVISKPLRLV